MIDCGIYTLLHSFHDLQCKEVKDRVYAIAGLADDLQLRSSTSPATSVASIAPDYGVSDEEVSQDLAFRMIQSGKAFSTRIMEADQSLASWAPDIRHPESWPLIATERNDDFRLVELCQSLNGVLTLKTTVYGWEQDTSWFEMLHGILPTRLRAIYVATSPPILGNLHLQFGYSVLDWRPLSVEEVFEPPEDWIEQCSFKTI